jgi:antitoxin HicB
MRQYPVDLTLDDNGTILVRFPDVPGAITYGENETDALAHAVDALETALSLYVSTKRPIPVPSRAKRGQRWVVLTALSEAKLGLYESMRASRTGKAALARKLNCHLPQIDRLLDLTHKSRLDQLEAAFLALGKRLVFHLEDAA